MEFWVFKFRIDRHLHIHMVQLGFQARDKKCIFPGVKCELECTTIHSWQGSGPNSATPAPAALRVRLRCHHSCAARHAASSRCAAPSEVVTLLPAALLGRQPRCLVAGLAVPGPVARRSLAAAHSQDDPSRLARPAVGAGLRDRLLRVDAASHGRGDRTLLATVRP